MVSGVAILYDESEGRVHLRQATIFLPALQYFVDLKYLVEIGIKAYVVFEIAWELDQ